MQKSIFLLSLLIISVFGSSQQPVANKEDKPVIEVTGSAETEVIPDEIYISILLSERNKNNDKWKIEVQEDNLRKKMEENGFDLKNLSLSGANGELEYSFLRKDQVLTQKWLLMKLSNAGEVNKFFKLLDESDIENVRISKTAYSQIEQLRREVKIKAIKAAKEKADYLLNAIGEQSGKPLFIKEQDYSNLNLASNSYLNEVIVTGYGYQGKANGFENQIAFSKIKVKYEILGRFEIK
jgi:uncharacterized protein YggE